MFNNFGKLLTNLTYILLAYFPDTFKQHKLAYLISYLSFENQKHQLLTILLQIYHFSQLLLLFLRLYSYHLFLSKPIIRSTVLKFIIKLSYN